MSIRARASLCYGQLRGFDRLRISNRVKAALSSSAEELQQRQLQEFRKHVVDSSKRFPFYASKLREHLGSLPGTRDKFLPSDLPLWTKEDQRAFFSTLNVENFRDCYLHSSGGSTGVPVQFYMTRASFEWRSAVTRRGYSFAQAEPGRRTFFIWSADASRPSRLKKIKSVAQQWIENRQFFNSFYFEPDRIRLCCEMINRFKPGAIVGYTGKLVEFATFCREHPGLLTWRTPNIVTAAEGLQAGQRELLETHVGGEVFMSYGSREFMLIGMESQAHCGYHLADDNLLVEVVDCDGKTVPAGQSGQIAVTDLHNAANPFVRYLIGDIGVMQPDDSGHDDLPFRRLLEVQGRNQEFVFTPDGKKLTLLYFAHNVKEFPWIDAFQIAQISLDHLVIRVCSSQRLTADMKQQLRKQLRPNLGTANIDVQQVDQLTRRPNGKIAVVVSELPESPGPTTSLAAIHAEV